MGAHLGIEDCIAGHPKAEQEYAVLKARIDELLKAAKDALPHTAFTHTFQPLADATRRVEDGR